MHCPLRCRKDTETVPISPTYQAVLPKATREQLRLSPEQKLQAAALGDRFAPIPFRRARALCGFLADIVTTVEVTRDLVVPTLTLCEVFKRISKQRREADALQATAVMQQGEVVDLTAGLALDAARLSLECGLPLADAVVLATARACGATLWTQDSHFEGMAGVEYRPPKANKTKRPARAG